MERKIDRFDKYIKYKSLNDNKVTRDLNISVGTLGKSRKPGRDLSDKLIEKILNFYIDINRSWLIIGEGPMLKETSGMNNITLRGKDHQVIGNILGGSSYILPEERPSEVGIELLQQKIDFLEKVIEEKDKMIAEKNKLIEEKERTISILLSNHKN